MFSKKSCKAVFILFLISTFISCSNETVKPQVKDIEELVFASGSIDWKDAYNVTAQTEGFQALIWHMLLGHPELGGAIPKWESYLEK